MRTMEPHIVNATTSTTFLHQLRDLWKSPRGKVLRIEALALVAIALSFLVAAFGSCRRWSNRWIVQKGFLAASVLALSLGTYSIGLMQSSSVKSEMYPVWAVSLFTLLPCIDPITSYYGFDYKSPLSKMVFQVCLYFGYVVLMSISTISGDTVNIAICMTSAITFINGFHRSLALVLPSRLREMVGCLTDGVERFCLTPGMNRMDTSIIVDFPPALNASTFSAARSSDAVSMFDILHWSRLEEKEILPIRERRDDPSKENGVNDDELSFKDVSFAFALSHLLQRHFLGLSEAVAMRCSLAVGRATDYMWALKLIEVELAFLYETFFTSNAFNHYYQAKAACLWTLGSFIGICFVGVTVATPGTMNRRITTPDPSAGTNILVVDTTTADLIITLAILVSLALLQLVVLIRCWTSKWSRVSFVCQCVRDQKMGTKRPKWWMRLKAFVVTSTINWFDIKYLWQDKLGQYSIVEGSSSEGWKWKLFSTEKTKEKLPIKRVGQNVTAEGTSRAGWKWKLSSTVLIKVKRVINRVYGKYDSFLLMVGLHYIGQVLRELWGSKTKVGASIRLHADVKASIAEFLGQVHEDNIKDDWIFLFVENGISCQDLFYYKNRNRLASTREETAACLLVWHVATCYCELAECEQEGSTGNAVATTACFNFKKAAACFSKQRAPTGVAGGGEEKEKHRRVAIALSKYYAYLVVSAPELLPGSSAGTKQAYDEVASKARSVLHGKKGAKDQLQVMRSVLLEGGANGFRDGVAIGRQLLGETPGLHGRRCSDHWKLLARFWVQAFVYIAPYGNVEAHMQHLSQGGEFITHLWTLFYHVGIRKWYLGPCDKVQNWLREEERKEKGASDSDPEDKYWSAAKMPWAHIDGNMADTIFPIS